MGFLKFLGAVLLVIIGALGLLYIFFSTFFAGVIAGSNNIQFSLVPLLIIGFVALVILIFGIYLLSGRTDK